MNRDFKSNDQSDPLRLHGKKSDPRNNDSLCLRLNRELLSSGQYNNGAINCGFSDETWWFEGPCTFERRLAAIKFLCIIEMLGYIDVCYICPCPCMLHFRNRKPPLL